MASTHTTATTIVADRTNTGVALLAVSWPLFGISIVVVALRLWTRISKFYRVGLDDCLMLLSLAGTLMHSTLVSVAFKYGMGRHSNSLTPENLLKAKHYIIACEAFAIITVMFGRLSFCVFFLGILGPTHKKQRIIIWSVIVSQIIGNTIVVIQVYAQCGTHLSALWDPRQNSTAYCQDPKVEMIFGYVQGISNIISDLVLTLLPGFLVWTLQVPRHTKCGLSALLMLSAFALIASILKAVAIGNLARSDDFTWNMVTLEIWCAVENNIVIISASIPTLRPLFSRAHPHTQTSSLPHYGAQTTHTKVTTSSCQKSPDTELQSMERSHRRGGTPNWGSRGSGKGSEESVLPIMDEILVTRTMQVAFDAEFCGGVGLRPGQGRMETPGSSESWNC